MDQSKVEQGNRCREDYYNTDPARDKRFLKWAEDNHWEYNYQRRLWWNRIKVEPATSSFKLYDQWYNSTQTGNKIK